VAKKKGWQRTRKDIGPVRRLLVHRLRARGMSVREVANALGAPVDEGGIRNPDTGEPFSKSTIGRDFELLDAQWQAALDEEVPAHKRAQLIEIRELRREAWTKGDLKNVLAGLKLEIELLGTKEVLEEKGVLRLEGAGNTYLTFVVDD